MKTTAFYQMGANFLMWLCVPVVFIAISSVQTGSIDLRFPKDDLAKLVEPSQLFTFLAAGALYCLAFAIVRYMSTRVADQKNAAYFAGLAIDEIASALFSFGSVLTVCAIIGAAGWYYLAAGLVCFTLGYFLKPREAPAGSAGV